MGLLDSIEKYCEDHVIKNDAITSFLKEGFPTTKDEEWKYTSLKKIVSDDYVLEDGASDISADEIKKHSLNIGEQIIFVNGVLHAKPDIKGLKIEPNVLKNLSYKDSISALNSGLAKNGYSISIDGGVALEKPLEILFLNKYEANSFLQYRNNIVVGENASVKIVENIKNLSNNTVFVNSVTDIDTKKDSFLEINKLQDYSSNERTIDTTNINQEKTSTTTINTLLFGGAFTRNNLNFFQNGVNCESNMNGIVILNNDEVGDNHTYVDHKKENCQSNELYKGIYLGKSKGVFNGKIMVRPDAQKINAFQANNNLLLSDDSSINSKPQLEIYADDVKCSHGCTIGQLDENALFYLRTRGISKEDANAILTFAFASEAMDKISIPVLGDHVKSLMEDKLGVNLSI